jgi:hypothetical protein
MGPVAIAIVSGAQQNARAFIAQHGPRYETQFTTPLVVRVSPGDATVRFHCVTANCVFPPQVQGDDVTRVDPGTYDVKAEKGVAKITLLVSTATVEAVTVEARPTGKAHAPAVRFTLTAQ